MSCVCVRVDGARVRVGVHGIVCVCAAPSVTYVS